MEGESEKATHLVIGVCKISCQSDHDLLNCIQSAVADQLLICKASCAIYNDANFSIVPDT